MHWANGLCLGICLLLCCQLFYTLYQWRIAVLSLQAVTTLALGLLLALSVHHFSHRVVLNRLGVMLRSRVLYLFDMCQLGREYAAKRYDRQAWSEIAVEARLIRELLLRDFIESWWTLISTPLSGIPILSTITLDSSCMDDYINIGLSNADRRPSISEEPIVGDEFIALQRRIFTKLGEDLAERLRQVNLPQKTIEAILFKAQLHQWRRENKPYTAKSNKQSPPVWNEEAARQYFQEASSRILRHVLKHGAITSWGDTGAFQCQLLISFVSEILTSSVLMPLLELLADPVVFYNLWLAIVIQDKSIPDFLHSLMDTNAAGDENGDAENNHNPETPEDDIGNFDSSSHDDELCTSTEQRLLQPVCMDSPEALMKDVTLINNITIDKTRTVSEKHSLGQYTLYSITYAHRVKTAYGREWRKRSVDRRFREFVNLHKALQSHPDYKGIRGPSSLSIMPWTNLLPSTVISRRAFLSTYLSSLVSKPKIAASRHMRRFLAIDGGANIAFEEDNRPWEAKVYNAFTNMVDKINPINLLPFTDSTSDTSRSRPFSKPSSNTSRSHSNSTRSNFFVPTHLNSDPPAHSLARSHSSDLLSADNDDVTHSFMKSTSSALLLDKRGGTSGLSQQTILAEDQFWKMVKDLGSLPSHRMPRFDLYISIHDSGRNPLLDRNLFYLRRYHRHHDKEHRLMLDTFAATPLPRPVAAHPLSLNTCQPSQSISSPECSSPYHSPDTPINIPPPTGEADLSVPELPDTRSEAFLMSLRQLALQFRPVGSAEGFWSADSGPLLLRMEPLWTKKIMFHVWSVLACVADPIIHFYYESLFLPGSIVTYMRLIKSALWPQPSDGPSQFCYDVPLDILRLGARIGLVDILPDVTYLFVDRIHLGHVVDQLLKDIENKDGNRQYIFHLFRIIIEEALFPDIEWGSKVTL